MINLKSLTYWRSIVAGLFLGIILYITLVIYQIVSPTPQTYWIDEIYKSELPDAES